MCERRKGDKGWLVVDGFTVVDAAGSFFLISFGEEDTSSPHFLHVCAAKIPGRNIFIPSQPPEV